VVEVVMVMEVVEVVMVMEVVVMVMEIVEVEAIFAVWDSWRLEFSSAYGREALQCIVMYLQPVLNQ
jgi:hypothetical protein